VTDEWLPSEHGTDKRPLKSRVARGLVWTITDNWGRQLLGLVVFAVLANLLQPVDFGLVALAAVFVAFAQIFVDQGLGDALIQRRVITRSHIDSAFWAALATGTMLALTGVIAAIPIAALLDQPELAPILQVLSLTFILTALTSIQIGLLKRELRFKSLALRSILAVIAGGVVGIAMAYLGYGAWSLVGQQLASSVASVITLFTVSPWRPSLHFSRQEFKELFTFGISVVGGDTVTFFTRNTDNLLIGAFLGTVPLGFYAVGYRILDTSQSLLINIARKVAFPALASLQQDPERTKRAYLKVSRVASAVIIPAYIGLALVAPELIVTVFGERWTDAGIVAATLFLIGPVLSLQAFGVALVYAAGHPEAIFKLRLILMIVRVVGFVIAVRFGIFAVAVAYVVGGYVSLPYLLYLQRTYGGIRPTEYLLRLRGLVASTAVMALAVLGVKILLPSPVEPVVLLAAEISVGLPLLVAAVWVLDRQLVREVMEVVGHATMRSRARPRPT
jgi:O-antigen/teichoic acid export membrane protein